MPKTSTTLKPGHGLPPRGRGKKSLILDAIRRESVREMLDLGDKATKEDAEAAYFQHIAMRALNASDPNSAMLLKLLTDKGWPSPKSTLEPIEFDFPVNGTPAEKSFAIVDAISNGVVPPDVGQMLIGVIKDAVVIEESTTLKERIEELEKALGLNV